MPFPLNVLDPVAFPAVTPRRVTLVHFARATSGFADKTAPDLDTRGGVIRTGKGLVHGPVAGLIGNATGVANHQIRIKVVRDRLDATAQLFPELESTADVSLVYPAPGQALSAVDVPAAGTSPERLADCVYLESASAGAGDPETKLKLRFGSATGPVIAEMGIVVYAPKIMFVQVHLVTINGPAAAVNRAKREKISATALDYLRLLKEPRVKVRFDIVEVLLAEGAVREVRHLPNAFPLAGPRRLG